MLARKFRLPRLQLLEVKQKGALYHSNSLSLLVLDSDLNNLRFGVVVSSQIGKRAIDRNKIRRTLYRIFNNNFRNVSDGCDILVLTKKIILDKSEADLEIELKELFKKLKLIN